MSTEGADLVEPAANAVAQIERGVVGEPNMSGRGLGHPAPPFGGLSALGPPASAVRVPADSDDPEFVDESKMYPIDASKPTGVPSWVITTAVVFGYALVVAFTVVRLVVAGSGGQQDVVAVTLVVLMVVYALAIGTGLCPLALPSLRLRRKYPHAVRFTALLEGPTRAGLSSIPALAKRPNLVKPSAYPWLSIVVNADGIQFWGTSKWGDPPFLRVDRSQVRSLKLTRFRIIGLPETGIGLHFVDSDGAMGHLVVRPGSRLCFFQSGSSRRSTARLLAEVDAIQGRGGCPR